MPYKSIVHQICMWLAKKHTMQHLDLARTNCSGIGGSPLLSIMVQVPLRAEEITIPADVTPERVPTHIVDYSGKPWFWLPGSAFNRSTSCLDYVHIFQNRWKFHNIRIRRHCIILCNNEYTYCNLNRIHIASKLFDTILVNKTINDDTVTSHSLHTCLIL